MSFLVGVLAYVGVVACLAWGTSSLASVTARLLGVQFHWFDVPAPGNRGRRFVVRLVSSSTPYLLASALTFVSLVSFGTATPSTRVEVLEGAAREAGLKDGDRVLSIARTPVRDWDSLRETIRKQTGPTPVEIERAGARQTLVITPQAGRIGVAPLPDYIKPSFASAASSAIAVPFQMLRALLTNVARQLTAQESAELRGPVGIVNDLGKTQAPGAFLTFLSLLSAYGFPFVVAVHAFDVMSLWLFRRTHTAAPPAVPAADLRLARLHQALIIAVAASCVFLGGAFLSALELPFVTPLALLAGLFVPAVYPLLWCAGRALWRRGLTSVVLALCLFVPCAIQLSGIVLVVRLRQRLRERGFHLSWWRAQPPTG
jgi:hypothetical protein